MTDQRQLVFIYDKGVKHLHKVLPDELVDSSIQDIYANLYWDYSAYKITGYLSEQSLRQLAWIADQRADFKIIIEENKFYHFQQVSQALIKLGVFPEQIVCVTKVEAGRAQVEIKSHGVSFLIPKAFIKIFLLLVSPIVFFKIFLIDSFIKICRTHRRIIDLVHMFVHIYHIIFINLFWHRFFKKIIWGQVISYWIYGVVIRRVIYGYIYRRNIYAKFYLNVGHGVRKLWIYRFVIRGRIIYHAHRSYLFLSWPLYKIFWFFEYQLRKIRKKNYG